MIAVVDYKKGNLKSVERGLIAAGGDARITADAREIAQADAIVLPGVGAFADAAATMCELGQMEVIRKRVDEGVPFLGICLGLHLMFAEGVEGVCTQGDAAGAVSAPAVAPAVAPATVFAAAPASATVTAKGLGLLPGAVTKMPCENAQGQSFKIPHVGWNSIFPANSASEFKSPLLKGIAPQEYFYFTHSYIVPDTSATIACTEHSVVFPSVVQFRDLAFGVQFHPEKSSDAGAHLLRNFVSIAKGA